MRNDRKHRAVCRALGFAARRLAANGMTQVQRLVKTGDPSDRGYWASLADLCHGGYTACNLVCLKRGNYTVSLGRRMPLVRVDGKLITDWESFHTVFAEAFGFPDFYGRNMNAWIDCMTSLDEPADGLTSIHGSTTDPVVLQLDNANVLSAELFEAVTECSAFVNWRRLELGEPAILMLSCWRTEPT